MKRGRKGEFNLQDQLLPHRQPNHFTLFMAVYLS